VWLGPLGAKQLASAKDQEVSDVQADCWSSGRRADAERARLLAEEERARLAAEEEGRQEAKARRLMSEKIFEANARRKDTPQQNWSEYQEFEHDDLTRSLVPEAQGHLCILWGEHGHGGYNTQTRGYIQGGQPMDLAFDLAAFYLDFEEAQEANDYSNMRSAVTGLRQFCEELGLSRQQERSFRRD